MVTLLSEIRGNEVFVSTQVLGEFYIALLKNNVDSDLIERDIDEISEQSNVGIIYFETIKNCLQLKKIYRYSYWDSLILATALENNCNIIYTEDMQHNQIIENKLKIVNPFLDSGT